MVVRVHIIIVSNEHERAKAGPAVNCKQGVEIASFSRHPDEAVCRRHHVVPERVSASIAGVVRLAWLLGGAGVIGAKTHRNAGDGLCAAETVIRGYSPAVVSEGD